MDLRHDKNSAVAPGKPGSAIYPDSPLGEDIEGIPTGRDVEWEPLVDYRRNGVITIFVGIGLYLLGVYALGSVLKGVGALVGAIGVGTLIAGHLYPNTGKELTDAVDEYEKK